MTKIILDQDYSNALICGMYESKKISFEPKNEEEETMFKDILNKYKRKKIKKNALVYALLYDGIELVLPFINPRNELILNIHTPQMSEFDVDNFKYAMDIREISLTNLSHLHDTVCQDNLWFDTYKQFKNANRKKIKEINRHFYNAACFFMMGKIEQAFFQIPDYLKNGLNDQECIIRFEKELNEGELSPLSMTLFIYMIWIENMSYMMKLSSSEKIPFITDQVNFSKMWHLPHNNATKIIDVYEKCIILMKQELPYIPSVNTFDDVLRIREKKELIRFKEVLNYWISLMSKNEINLANKMREDIIKANKELKRYSEYEKRGQTFFFWFTLFTCFIPVIPGITWWGIEKVTNKIINTKIEENSWVGIGKL